MRPEAPAPETGAGDADPEVWTVLRIMLWSADYLTAKGIERGRLDAELLLAHVLGVKRLDLYLQYDRPVSPEERARYRPLLRRRAAREPLQHVVGRASFRELELLCDGRALVPRPETEQLVGHVLAWVGERSSAFAEQWTALDIGTGSGCIALSLAAENPAARVTGVDVSPEAIQLAGENRSRLGLTEQVEFRVGSLYEPVADDVFDVIVANPPYVAEGELGTLEPEVTGWDPPSALVGGADGLDVIRSLVERAGDRLAAEGLLALEIGESQGARVADLIRSTGRFREPEVLEDWAGRTRFVLAVRREKDEG